MAVDEIREQAIIENVCLVGLRLGGTLSILSGIESSKIDSIALWDPVISGKSYSRELKILHQGMLRYAHVQSKHHVNDEPYTEILGFPYTDGLCTEIEKLDLLSNEQKPAKKILIIESNEEVSQLQLNAHLKSLGVSVEYIHEPTPQLWIWEEAFGKVRVPHQILQSIISWLVEVYP